MGVGREELEELGEGGVEEGEGGEEGGGGGGGDRGGEGEGLGAGVLQALQQPHDVGVQRLRGGVRAEQQRQRRQRLQQLPGVRLEQRLQPLEGLRHGRAGEDQLRPLLRENAVDVVRELDVRRKVRLQLKNPLVIIHNEMMLFECFFFFFFFLFCFFFFFFFLNHINNEG